jgi:membrane protein
MGARRGVDRLDRYQRRHAWVGFPLAVVYKFFDDQGRYLAALIAYFGFVSMFPLLLLFVTTLGFVLNGNAALQERIVHSALVQFPIIGDQIGSNVRSLHGSGTGLVVGIVGTVYGGLGVAQAAQTAMNRVWAVPRNERPNPIKARVRSLLLLLLLGLGALVTTALSGISTGGPFGINLGGWSQLAVTLLTVVADIGLFLVAFRLLTARDVSTSDIRIGAVAAGICWQLLQILGAYYVNHELRGTTQVYGLFGIVLGLVAWIYLEATIVVFCAEINVVARNRLWPRALLTPVTDNVQLTDADKDAYASYAASETFKGFEQVDVSFDAESQRDSEPEERQPR